LLYIAQLAADNARYGITLLFWIHKKCKDTNNSLCL